MIGGLHAALLATAATLSRRVYGASAINRVITQARKGKHYAKTSRYMPHQGPRECARRVRQMSRT